jgi:ABC-type transporter Mla subunit MlaD
MKKNAIKITNQSLLQSELNEIIKYAERKIQSFHKVRKRIDSFWTVVKALFNKNVYQQCVDDLSDVSEELDNILDTYDKFYVRNRKYFTSAIQKFLDEYRLYLECATLASTKRLNIQMVIQLLNVTKDSKYSVSQLKDMMNEMDSIQEHCLEIVKRVNGIAAMIKGQT